MKRSRFFAYLLSAALLFGLGACSKKKDEEKAADKHVSGKVAALPTDVELPASVLGFVVFGQPSETIANIEKLAGMAGPVAPGTINASVVQGLLKLGLKDTSVVDLKGPAGIMVMNPKQFDKPVLAALSIKGKKELLAALKPAWEQKDEKDGLIEVSRERLDTYGVFEGGAKSPPKVKQSMFLSFDGKIVVASRRAEVLKEGAATIRNQLKAAAGGLVGTVRVDHLRKAFGEEMAGLPALFKKGMRRESAFNGMENPEQMMWMLDWFVDKMFALIEQTRAVNLAGNFSASEAVATLGIVPEKDSFFSKVLAAQKHEPLELVASMPADHFMVMGFNVQWDMFKEDLMAFTKEAMQVFFKQELSEEMVSIFKDLWDVMGDEIVLSENMGAGGFEIIEVFSVKDEKKANEVFEKSFKLMSRIFEDNESALAMGMKFSIEEPEEIGTHDGVTLKAYDMNWDVSEMPPMQAKALKRMYGDKMRMLMATFDKKVAITMGKNAEQDLKDTIDRARGKAEGFSKSQVYSNAAGKLGEDAGGFMFMSIAKAIQAGLESTYAAMDKKVPDLKLEPPKSGMFMSFGSTPEQMKIRLRIPGDHLKEVGQAIQKLTSLNQ